MIWELGSCRIVGGMRCADGKAPFARGAAVLVRAEQPGRFLQVQRYGIEEAEGIEFDDEAWQGLVRSAQAMPLEGVIRAQRDAALWIFRPGFTDRDEAIARLSKARALLHREEGLSGGAIATVVREDLGNPIRDVLALESFDEGWQAAQQSDWTKALSLADLAFTLSRGLVVERIALLALALERAGRKTASEGLIEMARGSRGTAFGQQVRDKKGEYTKECKATPGERRVFGDPSRQALKPTVVQARPLRFREEIYERNADFHRRYGGKVA